jgi:hypothetical protein
MRLPWPAREYERTCAQCGSTWRVPRQFAKRRVKSISGFSVTSHGMQTAADRAELQAEIQSSLAIGEEARAFRTCPKCGSDRYSQRPAGA